MENFEAPFGRISEERRKPPGKTHAVEHEGFRLVMAQETVLKGLLVKRAVDSCYTQIQMDCCFAWTR